MSERSGWEMVGWGNPQPDTSAPSMFTGEWQGWHNMEINPDDTPSEDDFDESSMAVYRDAEGKYHSVYIWPFSSWDAVEIYVDDVLSEEY